MVRDLSVSRCGALMRMQQPSAPSSSDLARSWKPSTVGSSAMAEAGGGAEPASVPERKGRFKIKQARPPSPCE